jgi:hypothetical protein
VERLERQVVPALHACATSCRQARSKLTSFGANNSDIPVTFSYCFVLCPSVILQFIIVIPLTTFNNTRSSLERVKNLILLKVTDNQNEYETLPGTKTQNCLIYDYKKALNENSDQ